MITEDKRRENVEQISSFIDSLDMEPEEALLAVMDTIYSNYTYVLKEHLGEDQEGLDKVDKRLKKLYNDIIRHIGSNTELFLEDLSLIGAVGQAIFLHAVGLIYQNKEYSTGTE